MDSFSICCSPFCGYSSEAITQIQIPFIATLIYHYEQINLPSFLIFYMCYYLFLQYVRLFSFLKKVFLFSIALYEHDKRLSFSITTFARRLRATCEVLIYKTQRRQKDQPQPHIAKSTCGSAPAAVSPIELLFYRFINEPAVLCFKEAADAICEPFICVEISILDIACKV